ncbi:NAD(P)H-dependent glycerol-3-phosphate dehydrogenase [Cesiribacter andamanensis]|uniref:Glycerol-3-phosphate dehydrogenase [NAD(P)+] n=1 Tax=Cesiribacter andamanensis AMV16 TaxID=1279009 RepID=M7N2Q8_9BACT|nr:NAD(P)H-dependent glycerol-3-phosphate dehydrogenase [Cesiribacter andamanensis]EMR01582.1 Glycerol-3-phosphate dehydrogenase [NAD(P)+] [Cesiribacter andamanensis AMV16]
MNKGVKAIGVIGAGSFGLAMANMLAEKNDVLLYARRLESVTHIEAHDSYKGKSLHSRIRATNNMEELASRCNVIFPIVPAANFRSMMRELAPYLHPYHILIHGTKGLDMCLPKGTPQSANPKIDRSCIRTMSEVIREESVVVRIGCLAGPNLATELMQRQPAATVVASHFKEVINEGIRLLRTDRFQVYGSDDLVGVELCGVLKNIIAIASGAISGLGLGSNAQALLISRGMVEMIYLGKALGGDVHAFIGLAGVGDLVATCTSTLSRNFTVGYRLAQGETLSQIMATMEETAEGVHTVKVMKMLAENMKVRAPITQSLHKVLFEDMKVELALQYLMKYPFNIDVDFL